MSELTVQIKLDDLSQLAAAYRAMNFDYGQLQLQVERLEAQIARLKRQRDQAEQGYPENNDSTD